MNILLEEYIKLYNEMKNNVKDSIPLCAAETYISEFVKQPLNSEFEGKYYFFERNKITELKELIAFACNQLFHSKYTNAESLSGINCFTVCAMSLLTSGQKVLLSTPEQGGHASMPVILNTLNVSYDPIPYDFEHYQIDYSNLNKMCATGEYSFIIFCQSDLLTVPDLGKINMPTNMGIIYDATQTLGLIAGKCLPNPLDYANVVLLGGTHKTLPAAACGLIMTNTDLYIKKLSSNITPNYLRDIQPNHMACLLLALIEQIEYGEIYQNTTITLANMLGKTLEKYGFNVAKISDNKYTMTHQIFLLMKQEEADFFYTQALNYNITLNQKHKKLFHNDGIRLGTQQIARFDWQKQDIEALAKLLFFIKNNGALEDIKIIRKKLIAKKIPHFTYNQILIE
ncbi:MAG: hypothetical protein JTJ28_11080 [Lactobacillus sp.]|jgi:glycine hydroxymethyltransferase|nr:hypothetical protein [Lactobacillus sp.]